MSKLKTKICGEQHSNTIKYLLGRVLAIKESSNMPAYLPAYPSTSTDSELSKAFLNVSISHFRKDIEGTSYDLNNLHKILMKSFLVIFQ